MVARITAALAARKAALKDSDKGFTLIELLVVVIIIGVLAAIAIPIYIGVQENAKDSAVKSDLTNAQIALTAYYTKTSDFPAAGALDGDTLDEYGYTESADTLSLTLASWSTEDKFCITGVRDNAGAAGNDFSITSGAGVVDTPCPATAP